MKAATNQSLRVVLYEGAGSEPMDPDVRFESLRALLEGGYTVTRAAGGGRTSGGVSRHDDRALVVLGRFHPGAAEAARAGLDADVPVHVHELNGADAASVVATVETVRGKVQDRKEEHWKPWFPVIDYDRCTNCMQCLTFCLFDVYSVDDAHQITVRNQTNCKTDCPACSRVCPEVAILFPKYRGGPINGDEVKEDDLQREKMKVDISSLLGGDIYAALRDRSVKAKSRFSAERDADKALIERQRCLTKLKEQLGEALDIPKELLNALPTRDDIERKLAKVTARVDTQDS